MIRYDLLSYERIIYVVIIMKIDGNFVVIVTGGASGLG